MLSKCIPLPEVDDVFENAGTFSSTDETADVQVFEQTVSELFVPSEEFDDNLLRSLNATVDTVATVQSPSDYDYLVISSSTTAQAVVSTNEQSLQMPEQYFIGRRMTCLLLDTTFAPFPSTGGEVVSSTISRNMDTDSIPLLQEGEQIKLSPVDFVENTITGTDRNGGWTSVPSPLTESLSVQRSEPINDVTIPRATSVTDELQSPSFVSVKQNGEIVQFSEWIPKYLKPATQIALRQKMQESPSPQDKPGYLFALDVTDTRTRDASHMHVKVGSTSDNLGENLIERRGRCSSRSYTPIGWWPYVSEDDEGPHNASMSGYFTNSGPMGPYCDHVKELVHLELGDLAVNCQYLDPNLMAEFFPKCMPPVTRPSSHTEELAVPLRKCLCGKLHNSVFMLPRIHYEEYNNKEWELVLKPLFEKWGAFVTRHVGLSD